MGLEAFLELLFDEFFSIISPPSFAFFAVKSFWTFLSASNLMFIPTTLQSSVDAFLSAWEVPFCYTLPLTWQYVLTLQVSAKTPSHSRLRPWPSLLPNRQKSICFFSFSLELIPTPSLYVHLEKSRHNLKSSPLLNHPSLTPSVVDSSSLVHHCNFKICLLLVHCSGNISPYICIPDRSVIGTLWEKRLSLSIICLYYLCIPKHVLSLSVHPTDVILFCYLSLNYSVSHVRRGPSFILDSLLTTFHKAWHM